MTLFHLFLFLIFYFRKRNLFFFLLQALFGLISLRLCSHYTGQLFVTPSYLVWCGHSLRLRREQQSESKDYFMIIFLSMCILIKMIYFTQLSTFNKPSRNKSFNFGCMTKYFAPPVTEMTSLGNSNFHSSCKRRRTSSGSVSSEIRMNYRKKTNHDKNQRT